MKKRYLVFLLLIITLSFFAGYVWQVTHRLGDLTYSIQKITFGSEEEKFMMEAEYPVIESGIPENAKNIINSGLEKRSREGVQSIKSDFEDLLKDPYLADSSLGLMYTAKVKIKSDFIKLPFINIVFETYYYSGGAHGVTAIESFVFDALTGKKLILGDVLSGDYLNKLSELSLTELKKVDPKLETYSFAIEGTEPTSENFQTWTLESDGMHVIFGDYQVGPYVVGRPEIVIPYEKFGEYLNRDTYKYRGGGENKVILDLYRFFWYKLITSYF